MTGRLLVCGLILTVLSGCGSHPSPNGAGTAGRADRLERGMVVGVRKVGTGGAMILAFSGSAGGGPAAGDLAYEYIVRKTNGDLVSVAQQDKVPLAAGEKVLVTIGSRARVVPDFAVPERADDAGK